MHYSAGRTVILATAFAVCLCICRPTLASDHGGGHGGSHGGGHGEAAEEEIFDVPEGVTSRGINLGEFRVKSYYPVDAQKTTVRFALHISVAKDKYADMRKLVEANEHKLRDQVITVTRMTPIVAFDEPQLDSFRRRIKLRLLRALPELAIKDVHISEFQLTVKSL
jgi:hypothetical protein